MKTNNYKILKAQKVAEDIAKIIHNNGAHGEYPYFVDFIQNDEEAEELILRLISEDRATLFSKKYSQTEINENTRKLINHIRVIKRRRRHYSISIGIAAAVVVFSFYVYLGYINNFNIQEKVAVENNIKPKLVPIIVTEDGAEINLAIVDDSTEVGGAVIYKHDGYRISYSTPKNTNTSILKMIVPSEYTSSLVLNDGTEIYLNANSQLSYPTQFNGNIREVSLIGEAYFNVAKSDKPFIVKVDDLKIKVYGTKFNINAYHEDRVETVLIEGVVGVGKDSNSEVKLSPNEIGIWNHELNNLTVSKTSVSKHIQWMDGIFQYTNEPLSSILKDFETWYGIKFISQIKDINLSLYMKRNTPIEEVIEFIETINPNVKFIKEKGVYFIRK